MRCHYEVLGVSMTASVDEIKKAYRKCALQWHPDKHQDTSIKEEANKKFLEIQYAYETLSNDQERAWYDSHREVLINGGVPGEENDTVYLFNIYPFFSPSCFRGFDDDDKGFYTVYREMFLNIAEEDRAHYETETSIPNFGNSKSDYDEVVGPFYGFWASYCTPRSFVWCEKHDIREAGDRYVRRVMEKENKKLRDKAKKDRNEEIRKLVELVRKKDKRVEQRKKVAEERAQLVQQKVKEKKEADRIKRQEQMKAYVEPEWSTVDHMLDKLDLEEAKRESAKAKKRIFAANDDEDEEAAESEEDESDSNEAEDDSNNNGDESNEKMQQDDSNNANYEDESDYDDSLFCVACNKSFKSAKSFENHEKSKKHKDNVDLLKRHMNEDEANLFEGKGEKNSDEEEEEEEACVAKSSSNQDNTKQKLSKKQKKKRRQNRNNNLDDESSENDEADNEEKRTEATTDEPENVEDEEQASETVKAAEKAASPAAAKSSKKKNDGGKKVQQATEAAVESAEPPGPPKPPICSVCNAEFDTRNKLFDHIKAEGHAVPKTDGPMSHNALKKNKRLLKATKNK